MSDFEATRVPGGWRVDIDDLLIPAQSPQLHRSSIRTALTARRNGTILWTQNVNLTSDKSRRAFLKALAEKQTFPPEAVLIALEDVCRRKPPGKVGDVPPTNNSAKVNPLSWPDVETVVKKWLLLSDKGVLRILFGAFVAHILGGDPVWLFLIAPPGGAKTELLWAFYMAPGVYPISELTARTFASGLDTPNGDPSLLARLSNEVLILKDFTTKSADVTPDCQTAPI